MLFLWIVVKNTIIIFIDISVSSILIDRKALSRGGAWVWTSIVSPKKLATSLPSMRYENIAKKGGEKEFIETDDDGDGGARVRLYAILFVCAPGRKENYLLDRSQNYRCLRYIITDLREFSPTHTFKRNSWKKNK